jgi:3-polyprenyl-4-hydroxybenzoate decarboxylase
MEFRSLINCLIKQGEMVKINRKIESRYEMAAIVLEMENKVIRLFYLRILPGKRECLLAMFIPLQNVSC